MNKFFLILLSALALSGCTVVLYSAPIEPAYVAPQRAVVVTQPTRYYVYRGQQLVPATYVPGHTHAGGWDYVSRRVYYRGNFTVVRTKYYAGCHHAVVVH